MKHVIEIVEDETIEVEKGYACLDAYESSVESTSEVAFTIEETNQTEYFNGTHINLEKGYKIVKVKGGCVILPTVKHQESIYRQLRGTI